MKTITVISAIAAAFLLIAPAQKANAETGITDVISTLTASNGNNAGMALLGLYTQYKADGKFDIKNANNIKNLLTLASNIKGLDKTKNTGSFLSGLISGSKNLVNNNNSGTVLSSLKSLSTLDLSSLGSAAAKTAATSAATSALSKITGKTTTSTTSSSATNQAASILTSLFGKLK